MLKLVYFGRFMTPEGTETLILAFTSKTGQSVAHYRHRIFLFGFFCQREDIFRHFMGLISDARRKGSQDRTKQRCFFLHFFIDF